MASPVQLTTTFGATAIGTYLSAMMYGLTVHQTYRYYRRYTGDRWTMKTLVTVLWIIDTLQTVFSMHFNYHYLVNNYDNPDALLTSNWSFRLALLLMAGPPFISNAFYVSRLWIIGMRSIALLAGIMALVATRFAFQIVLAVQSWSNPIFTEFQRFSWMVRAYCGASLTADIVLAVAFCYTLNVRRTGYKRTDSKIDLLMIYTINTGSLTSLICLLSLMSLVFLRSGLVYVGLHALLGKLYVNTVLAVLNSRKPRNRRDENLYEIAAFESSDSRPRSGKIVFRRSEVVSPIDIQGMIRIHHETSTHRDMSDSYQTASSDRTIRLSESDKVEKMNIDIEKA
ncbi:hypothetical protein FA15DRAFT_672923 [Coprinopsis marcescibilis]|uniref:DUF6534 domain-containing protein n=1 Tax=Coprinopsis marcescibilis TaxID=230819 RepID=A0A5C3KM23_COPMA|nr:hypothetical protein FA15DRAFT_672923 [Coprinopsis marcescibilis]